MGETMRDRAIEVGLEGRNDVSFDYAYPVDWAREVQYKTNLWPNGIVWLYDGVAPMFGRPFPITMYGWMILRIYLLTFNDPTQEIQPIKPRRR